MLLRFPGRPFGRWTQKPRSEHVELDERHDLARDVISYYLFNDPLNSTTGGTLYDVCNRFHGIGVGNVSVVKSARGEVTSFDGTSARVRIRNFQLTGPSSALTLAVVAFSSNWIQNGMLIEKELVNASYELFFDTASGLILRGGGASPFAQLASVDLGFPAASTWNTFGATIDSGAGGAISVNGVQRKYATVVAPADPALKDLYFGCYDGSSYFFNGQMDVAALVNRAWTPDEHFLFHSDRFGMLRSRVFRTFFVIAAGGNIKTHTASGGLVASGAGTIIHRQIVAATGGLAVAGQPTITHVQLAIASGGLTTGGAATASSTGSKSYTASGGLTSGGSALALHRQLTTAAGGLTLAGTAAPTHRQITIASGGLTTSGAAIATIRKPAFAAGGLVTSGAAPTKHRQLAFATSGAVFGGAAVTTFRSAQRTHTATGGVTMSGSAAVVNRPAQQPYVPPTFAAAAGDVDIRRAARRRYEARQATRERPTLPEPAPEPFTYVHIASGGLVLGGQAVVSVVYVPPVTLIEPAPGPRPLRPIAGQPVPFLRPRRPSYTPPPALRELADPPVDVAPEPTPEPPAVTLNDDELATVLRLDDAMLLTWNFPRDAD